MSSPLQDRKKLVRAHFRGLQASFDEQDFLGWNRSLATLLISSLKRVKPLSMVAAYRSRPREANLGPLFGLPFQFCFPKVISDAQMEFRHVKRAKEDSEFDVGAYGILEPRAEHPVVDIRVMEAAFIPLLAFDEQGGRLGYGRGYYDRVLAGFHGLKVGVAFEWQCSREPLPMEAHDSRLDLVVTEKRLREFR